MLTNISIFGTETDSQKQVIEVKLNRISILKKLFRFLDNLPIGLLILITIIVALLGGALAAYIDSYIKYIIKLIEMSSYVR